MLVSSVPPAELYSIGAAAKASGISTDSIRIWERRYGRPKPVRLDSGHRRYTAEQIRWLRRVGEALAVGMRAGAVVPLSSEELDDLLGRGQAAPPTLVVPWHASHSPLLVLLSPFATLRDPLPGSVHAAETLACATAR